MKGKLIMKEDCKCFRCVSEREILNVMNEAAAESQAERDLEAAQED